MVRDISIKPADDLAASMGDIYGDHLQDEKTAYVWMPTGVNLAPQSPPNGVGIAYSCFVRVEDQAEPIAAIFRPSDGDWLKHNLPVKIKFKSGWYRIQDASPIEIGEATGGDYIQPTFEFRQHQHLDAAGGGALPADAIQSGTLPVERGGTGASAHTAGRLLVGAGTSPVTTLAPGASGNYVRSNGTSWAATALQANDILNGTLPMSKLQGLSSPPANEGLITGNGGGFAVRRINEATGNPTTSNDQTQGYRAFSLWLNTTTDTLFVCVDASTGAAQWAEVNTGALDLSSPPPIGLTTPNSGEFTSLNADTISGQIVVYGTYLTGNHVGANDSLTLPATAPTTSRQLGVAANTVQMYGRGVAQALSGRWYSQGGTRSIENTTTEMTLTSASIPLIIGGSLNVGSTIHIRGRGAIQNSQGATRTVALKLYFGAGVYAVDCAAPAGVSSWMADWHIDIGSLGAGAVIGSGDAGISARITLQNTGTLATQTFGAYNSRTLADTTSNKGVGLSAVWNTYVAGTTLAFYVHGLTIDIHN